MGAEEVNDKGRGLLRRGLYALGRLGLAFEDGFQILPGIAGLDLINVYRQ